MDHHLGAMQSKFEITKDPINAQVFGNVRVPTLNVLFRVDTVIDATIILGWSRTQRNVRINPERFRTRGRKEPQALHQQSVFSIP